MPTLQAVLDEEVVPERELVVHRREELEALLDALRPQWNGRTDIVYLLGPTGTGKTLLARLALKHLSAGQTAYVSCWQHRNRTDILYEIVDTFRNEPITRNATSQSERHDYLDTEPTQHRFIVLDEADQLADPQPRWDRQTHQLRPVFDGRAGGDSS